MIQTEYETVDDEPIESLRVRIRGQDQYRFGCLLHTASSGSSRWGLQETSHSQALVLMGDVDYPNICWKGTQQATSNAGGFWSAWMIISWHRWLRSQWRKALSWTGEVQEPERREQGKSRITTLDFRRTDFGLFSDLLLRVSWDTVPWRESGARELADF